MNRLFTPLLAISLFCAAEANAMTNKQLVDSCYKASAVIDKNKIPPDLVAAYNQCNAFLDGFIAGLVTSPALMISAKTIKEEDWPICFPGDFNAHMLFRDLMLYVKHGGEYKPNQAANTILTSVVFDTYTCK